ncbi:type II toxin-antitoxin system VapC family toxin [Rubrivirga sp. IMCC45206]|uniref:type II toxin-antitoxin system VapC family toxin n=1 Tax=Rubrivirga sp. IMCC45206 TaxID=3391614 RepID=UPI0039900213
MVLAVDTSVVLAVAVGEATAPALAAATRGAELIAPASLPAEIGNALSAMLKRNRISPADAERVLAAYREIPIELVDIDFDRSVRLAARLGMYAYDAYVLDCALARDVPLLSLDGGQRQAARRARILLHPF